MSNMYNECKRLDIALREAVDLIDMSLVRDLLDDGANPNSAGGTLYRAAITGSLPMVKLLLANGEMSPLIDGVLGACKIGALSIVRYLVDDLNAPIKLNIGNKRRSALFTAASYGNLNIVKYLLEKYASAFSDLELEVASKRARKHGYDTVSNYLQNKKV